VTGSQYAARQNDGLLWEQELKRWLGENGFVVGSFGQGQLDSSVHRCLRGLPYRSDVRWLPDILAVSDQQAFFVDAKFSRKFFETGRHDVEQASTDALVRFQESIREPVLYGFHHLDNTPGFIPVGRWADLSRPGRYNGNGSGTPFNLLECDKCCLSLGDALDFSVSD
jgi:hypothetical protein